MLCLAFMAKVGYEWMTGSAVFVHSQAAHMLPVPLAHGIGAVIGAVIGYTATDDSLTDQSRAAGTPFRLTS
jgi:lauroyl/myristoyl acyltransferase